MLARTILARSQACFLIHARGLQSRKGPVLPYYDYPLRDQDYQKPDLPNLMNQEDKDALSTKLKTIWESQSVSSDFSLNSDLSVKSKVLGECAKEFGPIPSNQLGGIGDLRGLVEFYWGLRESLEVPPPPPPPPNLRIYDSIADYREAVVEARKELVKKTSRGAHADRPSCSQTQCVYSGWRKTKSLCVQGDFLSHKNDLALAQESGTTQG